MALRGNEILSNRGCKFAAFAVDRACDRAPQQHCSFRLLVSGIVLPQVRNCAHGTARRTTDALNTTLWPYALSFEQNASVLPMWDWRVPTGSAPFSKKPIRRTRVRPSDSSCKPLLVTISRLSKTGHSNNFQSSTKPKFHYAYRRASPRLAESLI